MDQEIGARVAREAGDPTFLEGLLLVAVRVASLPVLLLVIALSALFYTGAILARSLTIGIVAVLRSRGVGHRLWDRPVKAHDV